MFVTSISFRGTFNLFSDLSSKSTILVQSFLLWISQHDVQTHSIGVQLLWEFGHFAPQQRLFVPKNYAILVCCHPRKEKKEGSPQQSETVGKMCGGITTTIITKRRSTTCMRSSCNWSASCVASLKTKNQKPELCMYYRFYNTIDSMEVGINYHTIQYVVDSWYGSWHVKEDTLWLKGSNSPKKSVCTVELIKESKWEVWLETQRIHDTNSD